MWWGPWVSLESWEDECSWGKCCAAANWIQEAPPTLPLHLGYLQPASQQCQFHYYYGLICIMIITLIGGTLKWLKVPEAIHIVLINGRWVWFFMSTTGSCCWISTFLYLTHGRGIGGAHLKCKNNEKTFGSCALAPSLESLHGCLIRLHCNIWSTMLIASTIQTVYIHMPACIPTGS